MTQYNLGGIIHVTNIFQKRKSKKKQNQQKKGTPQNTFPHLLSSKIAILGPKKLKKNQNTATN
jgi:hypothetical protein